MRGTFITFEGGETVGKSTQSAIVAGLFEDAGRTVLRTREPGGSPLSELIRNMLLSGACGDDPEVHATLFAAARAIHVDRTVRPALEEGAVVVCDRFVDSTRALQGASGLSPDVYEPLIAEACGGCVPDLTFVLVLPDDVLRRRLEAKAAAQGLDAFERKGPDYHREVNRRFAAIAQAEPDRCVLVDAAGSVEEVTARIATVLEKRCLVSGAGSAPAP